MVLHRPSGVFQLRESVAPAEEAAGGASGGSQTSALVSCGLSTGLLSS